MRHFVLGEDHRKALGLLRTHDVLQPADVLLQDLLIQKQESASGLTLRGGGHLALDGQMRQELVHVLYAHVAGMALAVKHDKAFDPTQIGCFGAYALVPGTNGDADLVQKFGGLALTLQHRVLLVKTRE